MEDGKKKRSCIIPTKKGSTKNTPKTEAAQQSKTKNGIVNKTKEQIFKNGNQYEGR